MCLFGTSIFLALPAAGVFSCSRLRGTQRARQHQGASVGPGRRSWHVLWGFQVARPHGEAFRARRAIQVPANTRTGLKNVRQLMWYLESWMSSMTSDITNLVIRKFFPDTNMPEMWQFKLYSGVFNYMRPAFANELITNQSTTNPIASIISEIKFNLWIIDQPTTQPIYIFFARGTINMILPLRLLS